MRGTGYGGNRWGLTEGRLTLALIVLAYAAVLGVGLVSRGPMIGDEVQHYYMVVTQAGVLPAPNVSAMVPLYGDQTILRYYPHVFLWHYLGAILWRFLWPSVAVIQVYQSFFYLQLLIAVRLLIRCETRGKVPGAELLGVAAVASLPITLLFSVVFYQDVAAVAQLVTALLLFRRRRWLWSAVFLCLAMSLKETVLVAVPGYLLCVAVLRYGRESRWRAVGRAGIVTAIVVVHTVLAVRVLGSIGFVYHPYCTASNQVKAACGRLVKWWRVPAVAHVEVEQGPAAIASPAVPIEQRRYDEISQSPGDLRHPANWLIFPGGVFWAVVGAGVLGVVWGRRRAGVVASTAEGAGGEADSCAWLAGLGVSCVLITAVQMRTAPDARFFLPGMLCLLVPFCRWAVVVPGRRVWLPALCLVAILQGGTVLARTCTMRQVPPGVQQAIAYLVAHPPQPDAVFMYPEGNARLFPCPHNWYLNYGLRDFWQASNDDRLKILHKVGLGAIVIKKYLVSPIDPAMNNLGVYPESFVRDIEGDPRFVRVLDNPDVTIYQVPPEPARGEGER